MSVVGRSGKVWLIVSLMLVLAAGVVSPLPPQQNSGTSAGGLVPQVLFTAVDKNGAFVTTLKPDDVRVLEDGAARNIVTFERQSDAPLLLAILLDTSASQERVLPTAKAAALAFINGVVRPGQDQVAIISFTGEATLEQELTGDLAKVQHAIEQVQFTPPSGYVSGGVIVAGPPPRSSNSAMVAGSTAIWDALSATSEDVMTRTRGRARRAIILLTDGIDTSSRLKLSQAIDNALQSEVIVYSIGIGDEKAYGVETGGLRKVSERTGGQAFFPKKVKDLRAAFTQIQQELMSQYVVAFNSAHDQRDGSFHKLHIDISNPELRKQGLRLAYPQGYFAGNAPTAIKH